MSKRILKGFVVLALISVLAAASFAAGQQKSGIQVGFKLRGGLNTINGGDFNMMIKGFNNYYPDLNDYYGEDRYKVDWKEMKWLMNFQGEFYLRIMNYFGIGLGFEYITKKNPGTITYNWTRNTRSYYSYYYIDYADSTKDTMTYEHTATVIPITLNLYGFFPLGSMGDIYITLGPGYYLGTFEQDYTIKEDYDDLDNYYYTNGRYWDTWKNKGTYNYQNNYKATSNVVGFHIGAGFNFNLMKGVAFFGEALYRTANFKDWQGDYSYEWTDTYQYGWASTGYMNQTDRDDDQYSGGLWYYDYTSPSTRKTYPRLTFFEDEPDPFSSVKNIRKGEININGIVLAVGIRIYLDLF